MKKTGTPVKATIVEPEVEEVGVEESAPPPPPKAKPGPKPKAEAPKAETLKAEKEPELVEIPMDPHDSALAQLGQERVLNAQLHLQNRQKEFEGLLQQVKVKYEEGGKYALTAIDVPRGVLTRRRVG